MTADQQSTRGTSWRQRGRERNRAHASESNSPRGCSHTAGATFSVRSMDLFHIARGIAAPATRPFRRFVRGAAVGSIDRFHQLVVGVVDVAMRGVRNEVVHVIDNTLGLPREGIRVAGPGPANQAAPIPVVAGAGNNVARAARPHRGSLKVFLLRAIACVLLVALGAFGQATWGANCAKECASASAPGRGGTGDVVLPMKAHKARTIDIRDAIPGQKDQVTAGGIKNRVIAFFYRVWNREPLKIDDEGNRPPSGDKAPKRGPLMLLSEVVRRINDWRAENAEMGEAFLQGPWVG